LAHRQLADQERFLADLVDRIDRGHVAPLDSQDLGVLVRGDVAFVEENLAERQAIAAFRLDRNALLDLVRGAVLAARGDLAEKKILISSHVFPGLSTPPGPSKCTPEPPQGERYCMSY